MQDLVTIVLPVYNVEKYLNKCIESVINQTYKNLEIILVDDGSPDNCPEICDSWAKEDNRIKVIHKKNAGLGMARNTGIDNATGKYILFFDSDDFFELSLVEKCIYDFAINNSDVVAFGHNNVSPDGKISYATSDSNRVLFCSDEVKNDFLPSLFSYKYGIGVSACCKMYKLDAIRSNNIRFKSERKIISEDAFFALELYSKVNKVSIIHEGLYYYNKRETSLSHTFDKKRQTKNNMFLTQCTDYVVQNCLPNEILVHIMARYHGMVLGTLMQIVKSDLSKKEKRIEIDVIFKDELLHKTLTKEVCCLDARLPRFFWILLKHKQFFVCRMLLLLNNCK